MVLIAFPIGVLFIGRVVTKMLIFHSIFCNLSIKFKFRDSLFEVENNLQN